MSDAAILEQARERYRLAAEAEAEFRAEMVEDLRFLNLEQWPQQLRASRESDVRGARPCLVLDKLNQHIRQIVNEIRRSRPSIRVVPVDDSSDPDTAKVYGGLIRSIEQRSHADAAYINAAEWAVRTGRGFIRLASEYSASDSWMQRLSVHSVHNPLSVYFDPASSEMDGADSEWCGIPVWLGKADFERRYPGAAVDSAWAGDAIGDDESWVDDNRIRISDYFYIDLRREVLLRLADGSSAWLSDYRLAVDNGLSPPDVLAERRSDRKIVQWCRHSQSEVLERGELPFASIPVVPVYGNVFWLDGRRSLFGATRAGRDPQRMYNYWQSVATELLALAPRSPYIGAAGQFEGFEAMWDSANSENWSRLEYNPVSIAGIAVPPPSRQPFAGVPSGIINQLQICEHDIQAAMGQYSAALGAPSNEHSGVAIRQRQLESDTANSHYLSNLAQSISHCGRMLIKAIPRVMDLDGIVRILGEDGAISSVRLDSSLSAPSHGTLSERIYNLGIGEYDVIATIGPSYSNRRQEAAEGMISLSQSAPQIMATAGDLVIRNMDWPGADQIADRIKRSLPPDVVAEDGSDDGLSVEAQQRITAMQQQYEAQLQQADTLITQMRQSLEEAQNANDETAIKRAELDIKRFEAESRRIDLAHRLGMIGDASVMAGIGSTELAETTQAMAHQLDELGAAISALAADVDAMQARDRAVAGRGRIRIVRDGEGDLHGAVIERPDGTSRLIVERGRDGEIVGVSSAPMAIEPGI